MVGREIKITGEDLPRAREVITIPALEFVADLCTKFCDKRRELLGQRVIRQKNFDAGIFPEFPKETVNIRARKWQIWPVPPELRDRKVEISGPASNREMMVKNLNSGAKVFIADAEDAEAPTWENIVNGHLNLYDAIRKRITRAVLFFRPRGLHLTEDHMTINGQPVPASLFDFGLYVFHNAQELRQQGSAPYFYLPKMEDYSEARWWNEIFTYTERHLDLLPGEIKATVLIETLPAAFQMPEILYELRSHSAGLNCGRWDYIFSYIKKLKNHPEFILPDRGQITMDKGFLKAYAELLVQSCHRRGAHAIGGTTQQVPNKDNQQADNDAKCRAKADKAREVKAGFDGTWVTHTALVPVAAEIYDLGVPGPNQLDVLREDANISEKDLLEPIKGTITFDGVKKNLEEGVFYNYYYLNGAGAGTVNYMMVDAATAEVSRVQLSHWLKHKAKLDDGRVVTPELIGEAMAPVYEKAFADQDWNDNFKEAADLFLDLMMAEEMEEFMTIPAYQKLLELEEQKIQ